MAKKRKTRNEKIKSKVRREKAEGFVISEEILKTNKKNIESVKHDDNEKKFFKADLTKTLILTMLVLALEIAIWFYLSRH